MKQKRVLVESGIFWAVFDLLENKYVFNHQCLDGIVYVNSPVQATTHKTRKSALETCIENNGSQLNYAIDDGDRERLDEAMRWIPSGKTLEDCTDEELTGPWVVRKFSFAPCE